LEEDKYEIFQIICRYFLICSAKNDDELIAVTGLVEKLGSSNDLYLKLQSVSFWLNSGRLTQAQSLLKKLIKFASADEHTKILILSFIRMALDRFTLQELALNYRSFFLMKSETDLIKKLKLKILVQVMNRENMESIVTETLYHCKADLKLKVVGSRVLSKSILITAGSDINLVSKLDAHLKLDCNFDKNLYFIAKDFSNSRESLESLEALDVIRRQMKTTSPLKTKLAVLRVYHKYSQLIPVTFLSLLRDLYISTDNSFEALIAFMNIHIQFMQEQMQLKSSDNAFLSAAQSMLNTVAQSATTSKTIQTVIHDKGLVDSLIDEIRVLAKAPKDFRSKKPPSLNLTDEKYIDIQWVFCPSKQQKMLRTQMVIPIESSKPSREHQTKQIPTLSEPKQLEAVHSSNEVFDQDLSFPSEDSPQMKSVDFSAEDDHLNLSAEHYLDDFLRKEGK